MQTKKPASTAPAPKERSPKAPDNRFNPEVEDTSEPQLDGNQQGSKRPGRGDQGDMRR
jgi:hypothetical protein